VREAIERFYGKIVEALNRPWLSPEERHRKKEAEVSPGPRLWWPLY
jgi:hypothetical protein